MGMEEMKKAGFSQTVTYGNHMYRREGEIAQVDFINPEKGIRKTIVDNDGNILNFPGFLHEKLIRGMIRRGSAAPIVQYSTYFSREPEENGLYRMEWEIQADGRYWEDEDGFGGEIDDEIVLYTYINDAGCFTGPFRLYNVGGLKYFGTDQEEELEERRRKWEAEGSDPKENLRKSVKTSFKILLKNLKQQIANGEQERFYGPDFGIPRTGNEARFFTTWFYDTRNEVQQVWVELTGWPLGARWQSTITVKRGTPKEICAWLKKRDSVEETARFVRSFSRDIDRK